MISYYLMYSIYYNHAGVHDIDDVAIVGHKNNQRERAALSQREENQGGQA